MTSHITPEEQATKETREPGRNFASYPRFARYYTRMTDRPDMRRVEEPLRRNAVDQVQGIVLEVGAGGGQNFPYYHAQYVTHLHAIEPDDAMLVTARQRSSQATIPLTLTQASVEDLPFPDEHFDSVLATSVFCSVAKPERGLREIWRVLKPGGTLVLLEHVRAQGKFTALVQDALVPLTTRLLGNCHWNRDTKAAVLSAGFQVHQEQQIRGGIVPMICLSAIRPIDTTS